MIQKMGRKNPMMNIIQWPFASAVNANMKNRITQIMSQGDSKSPPHISSLCGDAPLDGPAGRPLV